MDHAFRSKREYANRVSIMLQAVQDVALLASRINTDDHARLIARRDPEIEDDVSREAVERHSGRLGMIAEDAGLGPKEITAWKAFLLNGTALTESDKTALNARESELRAQCDDVVREEGCDDASSSYSDYSDSHTESSATDDEDVRDTEDEESM